MSRIDNSVGVIIPVYNRPRLVIKAIESVANQSVLPGKLIIVDDGSTDNTAEEVQHWLEKQKTSINAVLISTENRGVSAASNRGLQEIGEREYVAILGSDDQWPENFIERMTSRLRQNINAVAVTCDKIICDWKTSKEKHLDFSIIAEDPIALMIKNGGGFVSQTLLRLKQINDAGGFCESMPTGQDSHLFLQLALKGPWLYEPGDPVVITQNFHLEFNEEGHIYEKYDDAFLRWAKSFELFIENLNNSPPNLKVWKGLLAERWYVAGFYYQRKKSFVTAHLCFSRALYWNKCNLRYFARLLANLIMKYLT